MSKKINKISNRASIVIIGGGTTSAWLLEGFKKHIGVYNLSVVGSIADDGGSTGKLRKDLGVSGLGALRKCLLALSEADAEIKKAFAYRFETGELSGHAMGNIFMAALEKTSGSAESALDSVHKLLKVNGRVVPASFEKSTLFAELENDQIIEGETNIDIPKHDGNLKIRRIFLRSVPKVNPESLKKINEADLIIIGPGDLYTTVLPNFLIGGISETFRKSSAKKIFIANSVNKFGETNNFTVADFANEAEKYLGGAVDSVLYNSRIISDGEIVDYRKKRPEVWGAVKINDNLDKKKFVGKDFLKKNSIEGDADKLVEAIMEIENY